MSRPSNLRRLRGLLPLVLTAAYLMVPVSQVQAQECIEYTVWNPQTQRCECPDQGCCDFYYPFIPYGCPGKGLEESAVYQLLQYEPQREINGAEFLRLEFLSTSKATSN